MRTSVLCPVRGGQPPQGTTSPVTRSRAVGGGNTSQVRGGAASNGVGSSGGGATSSTSSGSGAVAGRASTSGGASGSSASASHDRPIGGRGSTASPLPTKGRSSTGGTLASLRHPRSSKVPQAASSNVGTDAASATPSTASTAYPSRKTSIDISIQTDDSWLPLSDLSHSQLRHCRHDSYDPPPYGGEFTPETLHLGSRTTVVGPQGAVVRGGPVRVRHAMSPWDSLDPSTWPSPRVALGDHAASNFGARGPSSAEPSPPGSVRSIRRSTVSEGRRHGVCSAVLEEGEITGSSDPLRVQRLEDQLASVTAERDKLRQFLTDLALRLGQTTSGTLCHQHIPITGQEFPHCSISSVSTGTPLGCTPGGASPVIATARLNLSELHAVLSSGCGADVCVGDDGDCAGGIPSPGGGGEAIVMLTADLDRTLGGEASGARRGSQAIGVCTPPVAVAMDGGQVSVSSSSRSSSMVSSRTSSPRGGCKKGFSKRALHGADCADETDEVAPMLPGSCTQLCCRVSLGHQFFERVVGLWRFEIGIEGVSVCWHGGQMMQKAERLQGTLARWRKENGFGFVKPLGGGDDVFCHITQLRHPKAKLGGELKEGDPVTYAIIYDGRSGKRMAGNVHLDTARRRNGDRRATRDRSSSSPSSRNRRGRRTSRSDPRERRKSRSSARKRSGGSSRSRSRQSRSSPSVCRARATSDGKQKKGGKSPVHVKKVKSATGEKRGTKDRSSRSPSRAENRGQDKPSTHRSKGQGDSSTKRPKKEMDRIKTTGVRHSESGAIASSPKQTANGRSQSRQSASGRKKTTAHRSRSRGAPSRKESPKADRGRGKDVHPDRNSENSEKCNRSTSRNSSWVMSEKRKKDRRHASRNVSADSKQTSLGNGGRPRASASREKLKADRSTSSVAGRKNKKAERSESRKSSDDEGMRSQNSDESSGPGRCSAEFSQRQKGAQQGREQKGQRSRSSKSRDASSRKERKTFARSRSRTSFSGGKQRGRGCSRSRKRGSSTTKRKR